MIKFPKIKEIMRSEEVIDVFITAMGFEDRSLGSIEKALEMNYRAKTCIVLRYDVYTNENEKFKQTYESIISKISNKIIYIDYYTQDRGKFEKEFMRIISKNNISTSKLVINISSLTTHALIWLFNFAIKSSNSIKIIYTSAESYSSPLEDSKSFASGVKEIFTMPEFSGTNLPGYTPLLIILLGLDVIRSKGIYSQIQPSRKVGIMAKSSLEKESVFYKVELEHKKNFGPGDELISFPIFDCESLMRKLMIIYYQNIEKNNISIALTGSKIQTLCIELFAKKFRDVQIILSTPIEYYPKRYSHGVGKTFEILLTKKFLSKFFDDSSLDEIMSEIPLK